MVILSPPSRCMFFYLYFFRFFKHIKINYKSCYHVYVRIKSDLLFQNLLKGIVQTLTLFQKKHYIQSMVRSQVKSR